MKPTDEKEEEGEKGMSDFSSDRIAGQLDFDELRQWGYTPRNSYRPYVSVDFQLPD